MPALNRRLTHDASAIVPNRATPLFYNIGRGILHTPHRKAPMRHANRFNDWSYGAERLSACSTSLRTACRASGDFLNDSQL